MVQETLDEAVCGINDLQEEFDENDSEIETVAQDVYKRQTWDKAMRELAAKNLTGLANDWLSQDEENTRDPGTDPITEEELARRISMTSLSVTSGGSFTAWFDCDEMFLSLIHI